MKTIEAQCRCGAIGLKIAGEPVVQLYCHCGDCQAAHGAAYAPATIYPAPAVEVVRGEPAPMVVRTTQRMRCAACGTYLFSELASAGVRSVSAMLLPKGEFKPQFHVQCEDAVLPVVDNLPHYKRFPAAFGGAETFVDW
ncbi:MAG TPA: GFA family protein [Roseiarcus sp.]|nr:GFA family protein [Roseiarcus sp.]